MRYQVATPASTVYYDRNRIIFRNENRPGPYMLIPVYWSFLFLRSPKTAVPVLARPRAREVGRESCLHSITYFYGEIALHSCIDSDAFESTTMESSSAFSPKISTCMYMYMPRFLNLLKLTVHSKLSYRIILRLEFKLCVSHPLADYPCHFGQ